jgi:hypothetical protein
MLPEPIILATSLVPGRDQALQAATVASWRAAGFEVISVNAATEADAVRRLYPGVIVAPVETTAEKFARKPVPYIHDLMLALKKACFARNVPLEQCTVGIINADIFLRPLPQLASTLMQEARGALILGPRVDVADTQGFRTFRPSTADTYSIGYDYFVMSADLLNDFDPSPFCLGMPFWDYWLPLVALLQGRPLKNLASPVALHVNHETRWDDTIYLFFHALISYVIELCRRGRGRDQSPQARQFDLLFDLISHLYAGAFGRGTDPMEATNASDPAGVTALADFYDRFQQVIVHHIKSQAGAVTVPEAAAPAA